MAYSITANTSNFTAGMVATKAELRDVKSAFLAGQPAAEKFSTAIAHLESLAAKFPDKAAGINRTIAQMRTEMARAAPGAQMLADVMGRVGIVMDPVSAAFQAFNLATSVARAGLQSLEMLVGKVADEMERLDELAKTSRNLGVAASDLVGFRRAAEDISGVDAGTFDKAFTKFGTNIGQAAMTGKGPTADALKRLGLDAGELSTKSTAGAMMEVADAMEKVENVNERLALSKGIMGKGGDQLATMLAAGGDEIRRLMEDQNRLAQTDFIDLESIEKANDSVGRLSTAMQGIVSIIANEFAPIVETGADSLVKGLDDATNKGNELKTVISDIAMTTAKLLDLFNAIGGTTFIKANLQILQWHTEAANNALGLVGLGGKGAAENAVLAQREKMAAGPTESGQAQAAIQANIDEKAQAAAEKADLAARKASDKRMSDWQKMQDMIVEGTAAEAKVAQTAQDKLIKQKWDALNDWAELEAKTYKHNDDKATKIIEAQRNGAAKLRDDFEEITELGASGFLSSEQVQRGLEDLRSKARDMAMVDSGPRTVGALRGGSVEALRQEFSGRNNSEKALEEARKQTELQEELRDVMTDLKTALSQPALAEAT